MAQSKPFCHTSQEIKLLDHFNVYWIVSSDRHVMIVNFSQAVVLVSRWTAYKKKLYIYSDTSMSRLTRLVFTVDRCHCHRWTRCAVSRFLFTRSHELSSDRSKFSSYYLASTIRYRRSKRHWYRCVGRIYDSRLFLFRSRIVTAERQRNKCRKNDDIKVVFPDDQIAFFLALHWIR